MKVTGLSRGRPLAAVAILVLAATALVALTACGKGNETLAGSSISPSTSPSASGTVTTSSPTPTDTSNATVSPTATATTSPTATASPAPTATGSTTTYTNRKLGFSITIGAPFTKRSDKLAGSLELGDAAAAWIDPEAARPGGKSMSAFIVGTMDLGRQVSDTMAQSFVDELLTKSDSLAGKMGEGTTVDSATKTTVAGRPAAVFDLSTKGPQNTPVKARLAIVVGSDTAYIMFATSTTSDWRANEPAIAAAMGSLRLK
jgi:hypothetical protein